MARAWQRAYISYRERVVGTLLWREFRGLGRKFECAFIPDGVWHRRGNGYTGGIGHSILLTKL